MADSVCVPCLLLRQLSKDLTRGWRTLLGSSQGRKGNSSLERGGQVGQRIELNKCTKSGGGQLCSRGGWLLSSQPETPAAWHTQVHFSLKSGALLAGGRALPYTVILGPALLLSRGSTILRWPEGRVEQMPRDSALERLPRWLDVLYFTFAATSTQTWSRTSPPARSAVWEEEVEDPGQHLCPSVCLQAQFFWKLSYLKKLAFQNISNLKEYLLFKAKDEHFMRSRVPVYFVIEDTVCRELVVFSPCFSACLKPTHFLIIQTLKIPYSVKTKLYPLPLPIFHLSNWWHFILSIL